MNPSQQAQTSQPDPRHPTWQRDGFLPLALAHAHPGYLRATHGVEPVDERQHFAHIFP
ncbi:MAG: hypothetical protein IBX54_10900 [Rhodoferax sp.]|nr:hypothetical protein [Rhodoferax sp.]